MKSYLIQRAAGVALVIATLSLGGCGTFGKMDLNSKTESVDVTTKSVVLLKVRLENKVSPDYPPDVLYVSVQPKEATGRSEVLVFSMDADGRVQSASGKEFLCRLSLKPGKYILRLVTGQTSSTWIHGNFIVPIHTDFEAPPAKVVYLGVISATNRRSTEGEEAAGLLFPLVDQAVTGFSQGTWDVELGASENADLQLLRDRFPALQKVELEKQVLPPWDRARAKKGWDYH